MKIRSQVIVTSDPVSAMEELERAAETSDRFVKIEKEDRLLAEDARMAIEKAYLASEERVVIVLSAPQISDVVQNKLLKVIEEPPPGKEFVIIVPSKSMILPTIRSRLPIVSLYDSKEEEDSDLDLRSLNLRTVYDYVQKNRYLSAPEMRKVVEKLVKEALKSGLYDTDEKSLRLFGRAVLLLEKGSTPVFVLTAVLLELLKKRRVAG